jgi:hypothetical protein
MNHSRVLTVRSRSDQNRAIESRDDNVSAHSDAQSRKNTEFFELNDGYFLFARAPVGVMLLPRARFPVRHRTVHSAAE